jgi:anti-sigma regulatory factor (Ser/Thr protein kinase)
MPDFDKHPESGYGLNIIRTVMDEVFYMRGNEYNILTMKKYFRKP